MTRLVRRRMAIQRTLKPTQAAAVRTFSLDEPPPFDVDGLTLLQDALLALPAAATIQSVVAAEAERHEVAEHLQEASSLRRGHSERPDESAPAVDDTGDEA